METLYPVPTRIKMDLPEGIKYCVEWVVTPNGETTATMYWFNRRGYLIKESTFANYNNIDSSNAYYRYTYDVNNLLISSNLYKGDNSLLGISLCHYDKFGHLVKVEEQDSGICKVFSPLFDNQTGLMTSMRCEIVSGVPDNNAEYYIYYPATVRFKYDQNKRLVERVDKTQCKIDGHNKIFIVTKYDYNDQGFVSQENVFYYDRKKDVRAEKFFSHTLYKYSYEFFVDGVWDKRIKHPEVVYQGDAEVDEITYRTFSFYD